MKSDYENSNEFWDRNEVISKRALKGETLEEIAADYDLTRERVRQVILLHTGRSKRNINTEVRKKVERLRLNFLMHVSMETAMDKELTCVVCGAWNVREGRSRYLNKGSHRFNTCGKECARDFHVLRHRLNRSEYMIHQSNHILSHAEKFDKYTLSHAENVRDGKNVLRPERFHVRKGTASYDAVMRVRKLRKTLGTEHLFDDEISSMNVRSENV